MSCLLRGSSSFLTHLVVSTMGSRTKGSSPRFAHFCVLITHHKGLAFGATLEMSRFEWRASALGCLSSCSLLQLSWVMRLELCRPRSETGSAFVSRPNNEVCRVEVYAA